MGRLGPRPPRILPAALPATIVRLDARASARSVQSTPRRHDRDPRISGRTVGCLGRHPRRAARGRVLRPPRRADPGAVERLRRGGALRAGRWLGSVRRRQAGAPRRRSRPLPRPEAPLLRGRAGLVPDLGRALRSRMSGAPRPRLRAEARTVAVRAGGSERGRLPGARALPERRAPRRLPALAGGLPRHPPRRAPLRPVEDRDLLAPEDPPRRALVDGPGTPPGRRGRHRRAAEPGPLPDPRARRRQALELLLRQRRPLGGRGGLPTCSPARTAARRSGRSTSTSRPSGATCHPTCPARPWRPSGGTSTPGRGPTSSASWPAGTPTVACTPTAGS
jgi:hypothetical protein